MSFRLMHLCACHLVDFDFNMGVISTDFKDGVTGTLIFTYFGSFVSTMSKAMYDHLTHVSRMQTLEV